MDFEIKFQSRLFREKKTDWYGRKGLSWHGYLVTYSTAVPGGGDEDRLYLKDLYLDHLCVNSTEPTAYSVCCILELVCNLVSPLLPPMKYFIIQCNNAVQYANNLFPVLAPIICRWYGIVLKQWKGTSSMW